MNTEVMDRVVDPGRAEAVEQPRASLSARGIRVRHGRGPWVIDGGDMVVPAGRIVGLGGPSGAGKSSLARVLAGLHQPQAGEVLLDGARLSSRRGAMSGEVAMLFQSPRRSSSPRLTVGEHVREAARIRGMRPGPDEVADTISRVGLTSDLLERRTAQISEGQLQRACLARAILGRPTYLICDEATAMLDPVTTASITRVVRHLADSGVGVLAISHDAQLLAAWADERWMLSNGKLIPDSQDAG